MELVLGLSLGDCSDLLVCWPHITLGETAGLETNLHADCGVPAQPGGRCKDFKISSVQSLSHVQLFATP